MPTKIKALAAALAALATGLPGLADVPKVATDIPPVHSLVARVMQGAGEPTLILPPGASPHSYSMRPSEAGALAEAEVVIWIGHALTPWLARAIEALSPDATTLELLEAPGTLLLDYRAGTAFADHDHGGVGQDASHGAGHEHADGAKDPHAWLDPENASAWLDAIAAALAEADPANAALYARNAAEGRAELDALIAQLSRELAPARDGAFVVFHDAYHYFEHRFGVEAAGAISLGDASSPSPARISEIRETVRETGARCVFAEPQFPADLIETVVEGTGASAATLDPLGTTLAPGPELYLRLLRDLADGLRDCVGTPR